MLIRCVLFSPYELLIDRLIYIAIPDVTYQDIIQHVLGQEMMNRYAVPLLIFDPIQEEIVKWIPKL